ncbi:hypothetical protein L345_03216, partial [Ophiophagus hannah]
MQDTYYISEIYRLDGDRNIFTCWTGKFQRRQKYHREKKQLWEKFIGASIDQQLFILIFKIHKNTTLKPVFHKLQQNDTKLVNDYKKGVWFFIYDVCFIILPVVNFWETVYDDESGK